MTNTFFSCSISLNPSLGPQELSVSKIRHLTASCDSAYLTDLNLGCVFIVKLGPDAAAGRYHKVKLDRPMGVDRDAAGNLVAASLSSPGALEVFDRRGYFLRAVPIRNCGNPCDVLFAAGDGDFGSVYLTDFKNKLVQQYRVVRNTANNI